jgi:hypothetical protein
LNAVTDTSLSLLIHGFRKPFKSINGDTDLPRDFNTMTNAFNKYSKSNPLIPLTCTLSKDFKRSKNKKIPLKGGLSTKAPLDAATSNEIIESLKRIYNLRYLIKLW